MNVTAFSLAQRYVGIRELDGNLDHPLIQWWLSLCGFQPEVHDETAWCSAFVNGITWELRLPRSKSAAARSWLTVGLPIEVEAATTDSDVVILSRGQNPAHGHVGFFAGLNHDNVLLLAGNQGNAVSIAEFDRGRILGVRRLVSTGG